MRRRRAGSRLLVRNAASGASPSHLFQLPPQPRAELAAALRRQVDQVGEVLVGQPGGPRVSDDRQPAGALDLRQPLAVLGELGRVPRLQVRRRRA